MNNKQNNSHFGEHITIDGYGDALSLLDDVNLVESILNELPAILGMRILAPAKVYKAEGNGDKDLGGVDWCRCDSGKSYQHSHLSR